MGDIGGEGEGSEKEDDRWRLAVEDCRCLERRKKRKSGRSGPPPAGRTGAWWAVPRPPPSGAAARAGSAELYAACFTSQVSTNEQAYKETGEILEIESEKEKFSAYIIKSFGSIPPPPLPTGQPS